MSDTAPEVEERGDKRVSDARVVYAVVAAGIDGNEGLVWL